MLACTRRSIHSRRTVIIFILLAQFRIHGEERGEVAVGRCTLPVCAWTRVPLNSCWSCLLIRPTGVRADGGRRVAGQAWRRSGVWEVARRELSLAGAFSWGLLRHVSRFFRTIHHRALVHQGQS